MGVGRKGWILSIDNAFDQSLPAVLLPSRVDKSEKSTLVYSIVSPTPSRRGEMISFSPWMMYMVMKACNPIIHQSKNGPGQIRPIPSSYGVELS